MSRLLSKIMLALLMLPLAALVYMLVVTALLESILGYPNRIAAFIVADLVTAAFVAGYWIVLWHGVVRWTSRRVRSTFAAGLGAVVIGAVAGGLAGHVEDDFGAFVAGLVAVLVWLTATVLIWRETADERSGRLRGAGRLTVACPRCGYNLTGLQQTTCPECGTTYTIDELIASQPSGERAEFEERSA